jgi:deoxyribose-phosphate aldolase
MSTIPHTDVPTSDLRSAMGLAGTDTVALRRFVDGLPSVDPVGVEARAAQLASRSIKKESKRGLIDLAISMVDLTTLEGADTPGKVRALCRKGVTPDAEVPGTPSVAAICVYPDMVATAVETLRGSGVGVASVATAFPAGRSSLAVKLADTALAVETGADEIDMVIDRGAFLSGDLETVFAEIAQVKEVCGDARLKVILETGELGTYDNVRRASWLALLAGADFIKTSTGKIAPAATLPVTQVMLQAVRDLRDVTGAQRAVKPAGGIRTTKDAIAYLVMVHEVAGAEWLAPRWFRFGASGVVNDLLMQRRTQTTGHYSGPRYVSVD